MEKIEKTLEKQMKKPLSGNDLQKIARAPIVLIRDLVKYKSIDELLGNGGGVYLLYEQKDNVGHWCCLTKTITPNGSMTVEFFDPYSGMPDSQLEYIDDDYADKTGQSDRRLTRLLIDCPYDISYNEFGFQRFDDDVSTCGRWVGLRMLLKDMPLEDFNKLFLEHYEPGDSDYIATLLTA